MKLSFITDEVTQSFAQAVAFALENELEALELRTVDDTAIDMIPLKTLHTWKSILDKNKLKVCALSGSFYKCDISEESITAELEKLERLCNAADVFGCEYIRGFAFFAKDKLLSPQQLAPYFLKPCQLLKRRGKTLLLEADPSVNTSNHETLAALIKQIDSPQIKAIYDPGNDLYDPLGEVPFPNGYNAIKAHFCHVHLKDGIRATPESFCVKIGDGEVGYYALLKQLMADGYAGYMSLETHYRLDTRLSEEQMRAPGGAAFSNGGHAATKECVQAVKSIINSIMEASNE